MRIAAGMTQVQLAQQMGVEQTTVSRLERQSDWKLSTLIAYMKGCSAAVTLHVDTPSGSATYRLDGVAGDFVVL